MNKISEFLTDGSVTLTSVDSPINGTLTVKWDAFAGYQILGGGLWQVGGPVEDIWRVVLRTINNEGFVPKNCLILGLGGGTIAKLVRKNWSDVIITGVDIDPVIVDLGKKYMNLNKLGVDIHISDAATFKSNQKYDLICVDMYVGDKFPEKFEQSGFLQSVRELLSKNGKVIFNRLYYGTKRKDADLFEKKLKTIYPIVKAHYPEVSALYECTNS